MIYVTQLIYINKGQEKVFDEFESVAIPIIAKYNGKLLLRIRPDHNTIVESNTENPYEVHLVEFGSDQDFENFKLDKERSKFIHLKQQAIKSALLIKGVVV
jgi:uncharacterized protein (DUF1330 family)